MLQQDITAEQRMGYLAAREYGTLFVENRYTDFGNYYPHRTLRNLWMLARYVPAQRMLFELLNPARNTERSGAAGRGAPAADHRCVPSAPGGDVGVRCAPGRAGTGWPLVHRLCIYKSLWAEGISPAVP